MCIPSADATGMLPGFQVRPPVLGASRTESKLNRLTVVPPLIETLDRSGLWLAEL
jgi:hypothetical protein